MAYIKRKGLRFNVKIITLSLLIIILMILRVDWAQQFRVLVQYDILSEPIISPVFTMILLFIGVSFAAASFWYFFGKIGSPLLSGYLSTFFGGITSETFLDKNVNKADMRFFKFLGLYINTFLVLFTLDFFFASTFFYNQGLVPQFRSFVTSLAILSIFQPFHLIFDGIGIRAYNAGNAEVTGITSVLDRFVFRLLQTGGLLGVFASITIDTRILDQVPQAIRIIFVRTAILGLLIMLFYQIFYQAEGVPKSWEKKKIRHGETQVVYSDS